MNAAVAQPAMSVIVIGHSSESTIEKAIRSVVKQEAPEPFEIVVVVSGEDRSAELTRSKFPDLKLISSTTPLLPGGARNAGLAAASGEFIAYIAGHAEAAPDWIARRLELHREGRDVVAGAISYTGNNPIRLASHYILYVDRLPSRPPGLVSVPDPAAHSISFRRTIADLVGPFDESVRIGEDTEWGRRLAARGIEVWFDPRVVISVSGPTALRSMLLYHFRRGRRESTSRGILWPDKNWWVAIPLYVLGGFNRLRRTIKRVRTSAAPSRRGLLVLCVMVLGSAAARLGWILEQLRMRRSSSATIEQTFPTASENDEEDQAIS